MHPLARLQQQQDQRHTPRFDLGAPLDGLTGKEGMAAVEQAVNLAAIAQKTSEKLPPALQNKEVNAFVLDALADGKVNASDLRSLVKRGFEAGSGILCEGPGAAIGPLCDAAATIITQAFVSIFDGASGSGGGTTVQGGTADERAYAFFAITVDDGTGQIITNNTFNELLEQRDTVLFQALALFANDPEAVDRLTETVNTFYAPSYIAMLPDNITLTEVTAIKGKKGPFDFTPGDKFIPWQKAVYEPGDSYKEAMSKMNNGVKSGPGGGCAFPLENHVPHNPEWTDVPSYLYLNPLITQINRIWKGTLGLMFGFHLPWLAPEVVLGDSYQGTWVAGKRTVYEGDTQYVPTGSHVIDEPQFRTDFTENCVQLNTPRPYGNIAMVPSKWAPDYLKAIDTQYRKEGMATPLAEMLNKAAALSGSYWEQRFQLAIIVQKGTYPVLENELKRRLGRAYAAAALNAKVIVAEAVENLAAVVQKQRKCSTSTCVLQARQTAVEFAKIAADEGVAKATDKLNAQLGLTKGDTALVKLPGGGTRPATPAEKAAQEAKGKALAPKASTAGRVVVATAAVGTIAYLISRFAKTRF